jgi:hypothetical protein
MAAINRAFYGRWLPVLSTGQTEYENWPERGYTGDCSGPEVGFEEITIDLPQARFWIAFGWSKILTMTGKRVRY